MKKVSAINIVYVFITVAFIAWVTISSIDVMTHQFSGGTKAEWNFYRVVLKLGEAYHGVEYID